MPKLNIGCRNSRIEDYKNCDIVDGPCVDYICSADKLPFEDNSIDEVLSEHMIEHLTFEEFNRSIVEWHRVLKVGGSIIIECPDLMGVCKAFVDSNHFNQYFSFAGYWPLIAHFYGHQRGASPEEKLSQVHKSGYTVEHLRFCLEGIGFKDILLLQPMRCNPSSPTIRLIAKKV